MIKTRITEMFGIKYPIISAPMGPFYTTELSLAVSEAGGLGVLSHTNLRGKDSIQVMEDNLNYMVEHTDKPFGFNIRTARMQPDAMPLIRKVARMIKKDSRLREQCVYGVTSAGTPRKAAEIWKKKAPSIKHFHVAPAQYLAQKVVNSGCDGLIVTGVEGGGHQSYEEISTLILLQEAVKAFPDVPLVACGGFATPEGIAMALTGGADAVAMGTRFIATDDSEFHENYKDLIYPASDQDTLLTTGAFGPIRLLKNKYSLEHGKILSREEKLQQEAGFTAEQLNEEMKRYELVYKGDVENGAILAGQTVGLINSEMRVGDMIPQFIQQAEKIMKEAVSKIN
ncbi:MAG: Nitronate monooxygenase [Promethearchaeota archaeon]|nr:MAG: Nitronate monooxygenase [Candidatus Lokiarchaeota archaeon]